MEDVEGAVQSARQGNAQAWRDLVDGHSGLVWSVIRRFRLDTETSKDVFQTVWLRLAEHLDQIREPDRLASWLGQTTRNECVGVLRQRDRLMVHDDAGSLGQPLDVEVSLFPRPGDALETEELRRAVAAAYHHLGRRCQELLAFLVADPPVSYVEISERMGMPVGSIGPTRARCLEALRTSPEISRITGRVGSS
jgi:RNA polymerase sigma factor (sigma-70 family)